jgi:hypothetical protein
LHLGGKQMAEVTFSSDLRWYRLASPLANGQPPSHQLFFAGSNLSLARTASDGPDLYLLADIPASPPGFLTASLTVWQEDFERVAALLTGNQEEAKIDAGLRVTLVAAGTDVSRVVDAFLRDLASDWDVIQGDEAITWRLVRRPAASRRLPPVCQLSLADGLASFTTMVPLGDEPPADTCAVARSHFLLRLNSGWHVAGRLLRGGVQLRAALPVPGLQATHLRAACETLLEAYKFSALELQVLGEEALASFYLRLQTNY